MEWCARQDYSGLTPLTLRANAEAALFKSA